jgi:hypothetical protein
LRLSVAAASIAMEIRIQPLDFSGNVLRFRAKAMADSPSDRQVVVTRHLLGRRDKLLISLAKVSTHGKTHRCVVAAHFQHRPARMGSATGPTGRLQSTNHMVRL